MLSLKRKRGFRITCKYCKSNIYYSTRNNHERFCPGNPDREMPPQQKRARRHHDPENLELDSISDLNSSPTMSQSLAEPQETCFSECFIYFIEFLVFLVLSLIVFFQFFSLLKSYHSIVIRSCTTWV